MALERVAFREALISRMDLTGVSAAELARRSGVSKPQIDKLRQRKVEATNVHDAVLIARAFGQSVEEFIGVTSRLAQQQEILQLFLALPASTRQTILIQVRALAKAQGSPLIKSAEEGNADS